MADLHDIGGIPAVLHYLLSKGLIHGSALTVTGSTLAENLSKVKPLSFSNQSILVPLEAPIKDSGHICILKGNLSPLGAVAKITGKEGLEFSGPATVFDSELDMMNALKDQKILSGQVIVIRYVGPKGGPGMPEMRKFH